MPPVGVKELTVHFFSTRVRTMLEQPREVSRHLRALAESVTDDADQLIAGR